MDGLLSFIKNLGTGRLIIVGLVGALTITFFAFIIGRLQSAPMAILFSDLEPAQAAEVVGKLEASQVPYETGAGGRVISVPKDQVDRLRLTLAADGLTGGVIGKEIFDREGNFGRTSFELNVNYARAIEGELARTIAYINTVREARVQVVMPERRPFQRELSQPKASILLRTSGGGVTRQQVRSIQALVASAIPGLSSESVTITDASGRLLSDGNKAGGIGSFSSLEEARLAKEDLYRSKIESLIGRSVGPENVRAEVSIEMDTSRKTQNEVRFDPDGQVITAREVRETESSERSGAGQVTIANNLPENQGSAQSGPTSSNNATDEITNFSNSKIETVTVTEPGQITKLRVSVMVNGIVTLDDVGTVTGYTPRTAEEISTLEDLVKSSVPYDETRDGEDSIIVRSIRFVDPLSFEQDAPEFALFGLNKEDLVELIQTAGLVITSVLILLLVVRPIVSRVIEAIPDAPDPNELEQLANQAQATPALAGPNNQGGFPPEIFEQAAAGDEEARALVDAARASGALKIENLGTDSRIDVARVEGRIQDSTMKKVSDIIQSNPDDSAAIVRNWMYAE